MLQAAPTTTTNLPASLAALQRDHANFQLLLNVLDKQIEIATAGGRPRFDLVEALIAYFRVYPAQFHHAKEDIIYGHLLGHAPAAAKEIYGLVEDHRVLPQRLALLEKSLRLFDTNEGESQWEFCVYARLFLANERKHIAAEESEFFPLAAARIAATEWEGIEGEISHLEDPLFGLKAAGVFAILQQEILKAAPAFGSA